MRALFHDPLGPVWTRLLPYAVTAAAWAMCILGVALDQTWLAVLMAIPCLGVIFVPFLGPMIVGRRQHRQVDLEVAPGFVRVRNAGVLDQTVRARSLRAASVARMPDGSVSVALQIPGRSGTPLIVELENETEGNEVCRALGLGKAGFGIVTWWTRPRWVDGVERAVRIIGALLPVASFLALVGRWEDVSAGMSVACLVCLCLLPIFFVFRRMGGAHIAITPSSVLVREKGTDREIPFTSIDAAGIDGDELTIARTGGGIERIFAPATTRGQRGMANAERAHVRDHITWKRERAKDPAGASEAQTAVLSRGTSEIEEWVARLDCAAKREAAGGGYRVVPLDNAELWETLENPNADLEMRAGAARVLAISEPDSAMPRIEAARAAMREPEADDCLRMVLETRVRHQR